MKSSNPFRTGLYRHYKGNQYQVFDTAIHSETEEKLVVYKPVKEIDSGKAGLWVRPFEMFFETIIIDGKETPRFEYIGKP